MTDGAPDTWTDAIRAEAHDWIVRMHGPDAAVAAGEFQSWLDASPEHAIVYRDLQAHWDRAKFLTHTKTGQARDLASVAVWYRRPGPRWAAVATAAIFVVAASLVPFSIGPRSSVAPFVAYSTRVGEMRTVALADGTTVTMDAASRMQVSISTAAREVRLVDGSARFDVKPEAARTFAVVTGRGTVITNGGLFDVTRTPDLIRVTALIGSLKFRGGSVTPGLGSSASFAINPGQRLSLTAAKQPQLVSAPQSPPQDWTAGMLSFDGERLADAIVELNRHNTRKIVLADAAIAELRITGAFHADDPDGFARAVAGMFGLVLRDVGSGAIELSRKK